jgi:membrane fusion protein (multidrug efflux system)
LLEPGTRLLALVPLDKVYVEANFKETRISDLKVGQPVDIAIDAFRADAVVKGRIESISPAAGQEFSLLPPQNATGNFTKIVQRVPVRISIPPEVAGEGKLRPGLSVVVSVDTHDPRTPRPTLLGLLGLKRPGALAGPSGK